MGKGEKRSINCLGCETIEEKKSLHKLVAFTFLAFRYYYSEKTWQQFKCVTFLQNNLLGKLTC
jgi:hypothetical protein